MCVVCIYERSRCFTSSLHLTGTQDLASWTKVEQHLLCVQAKTSAKHKLLAVKWRCFALQIIVVGNGAVEDIVTS